MKCDFKPDTHKERDECVMVLNPDAVIDPRAVVVKPFNTLVADGTVTGSCGSDYLALRTEICRIYITQKLYEMLRFVRFYESWVLTAGKEKC